MRTAAIGIGSNSLRMLIADLNGNELHRIKRYREGLRVFAALDSHGNITPEMIRDACSKVGEFRREAVRHGAENVHLFATSAVRDAANQEEFSSKLLESTGLPLEICTGEEEASLSFWGAAGKERSGMIDIGGGSTEIVLGQQRMIDQKVSLQMGAVRLYRAKPIVTLEDADSVIRMAEEILLPVQNRFSSHQNTEWIGVGGTFTTCAALVQRIPWQNRENIHGFILTKEAVRNAFEFLAPLSLEQRISLEYLQPQRADIVVHGMAILLACMNELHIPCITVSEYGNLEGYLKAKYLFSKRIEQNG